MDNEAMRKMEFIFLEKSEKLIALSKCENRYIRIALKKDIELLDRQMELLSRQIDQPTN